MRYRSVLLCISLLASCAVNLLDVWRLGALPEEDGTHCKRCACDQAPKSLPLVQTFEQEKPVRDKVMHYNKSWSDVKGIGYLDKLSRTRYETCQPKWGEPTRTPRKMQCQEMTFQEGNNPIVALASPPGSGNTWVRYLLEQAVGVYTGSIYCDPDLKAIYPGEKVASGNVLVVKTHRYTTRELPTDMQAALGKKEYDKAILLLRNPYNSLLSEANRKWNSDKSVSNHVGLANDIFLTGKKIVIPRVHYVIVLLPTTDLTSWDWFVQVKSGAWLAMLRTWLEQDHVPVMIIEYEKLMTDLRSEVLRMLKFLGREVPNESLDCAIDNANGSLKRTRHLNMDPFSKDNKAAMDRVLDEARPLLQKHNISYSVNAEPFQRTS